MLQVWQVPSLEAVMLEEQQLEQQPLIVVPVTTKFEICVKITENFTQHYQPESYIRKTFLL
jgi:hypothetical protein